MSEQKDNLGGELPEDASPEYILARTRDHVRQDETVFAYCERRFSHDLTSGQKALAISYLRQELPADVSAKIHRLMQEHGRDNDDWMTHYPDDLPEHVRPYYSFHFMEGMGTRNALRQVIPDNQLPSVHGWDDFYVPVLMRAADPSYQIDGTALAAALYARAQLNQQANPPARRPRFLRRLGRSFLDVMGVRRG